MIVEAAIVRANCRKNSPLMPAMSAVGTKTAQSTRAMAITGPETSAIARRDASREERPIAK